MKLNKNSGIRAVGLSSFFALLALFGMAVFCPTASESASAATRGSLKLDFVLREALKSLSIDFFLNSSGGINYEAIAKELGIDFQLASSLTLTMSDPSPANVTGTSQPLADATFFSGSTTFNVASSASDGFAVYVYGANGTTTMNGQTTGNTTTIPTLSGTGTTSTAGNWWGYKLGEASAIDSVSTYNGVAATRGTAAYTSSTGTQKNLKLVFGTKVNPNTLTPDTYKGTVNVYAAPGAAQQTARVYTLQRIDKAVGEIFEERAAQQGITVEELIEKTKTEAAQREAEQQTLEEM